MKFQFQWNFAIFWLVVRMCDHRLRSACIHAHRRACSMHRGPRISIHVSRNTRVASSHVIFDTSSRGVRSRDEKSTTFRAVTCVFWEKQLTSLMRRNVSSSCRRTKFLKSLERRSFSSRHRRSLTILRKNDDFESILMLEQLLQAYMYVIQICNREFRYKSTDCMHAGQVKQTHTRLYVCIMCRDKHTHITLRGTGTVVSQTPELKTLVNNRSVTGRAP